MSDAPGFRGQVEELLPLTDVTQSMPRIPLAAVLPALGEPEPSDPGRTLLQVGAFALVLAASTIPVLRYTGVLGGAAVPAPASVVQAAAAQPAPLRPALEPTTPRPAPAPLPERKPEPVAQSEASSEDPVAHAAARIAATLPAAPDQAADELVAEAERALGAGEERLAETLLGHALKRDEKNPHAAYALAKMRLSQNNLEGAEGWVLAALRLRPRRAEYHALYGDILARQGHAQHAKRERKRAKELRR